MGLFLKGIGLTMEESLTFWKSEFTKKKDIDGDKFEKNYAYNIRHSYGAEGKRNDYKPWNCTKVINLTQPGPTEQHGCPFKVYSDDQIVQVLASYGISREEIDTVMKKKRENLY
jgi:DNA primase large subunit